MNSSRTLQHPAHDARRRPRVRESHRQFLPLREARASPLAAADIASAAPVGCEREDAIRQQLSAQRLLFDHFGSPCALQRQRVVALVIVGRRRQRHQNRRPASRGDLGQRRRPARDTTSPAALISRSIASMNRSTRPCNPLARRPREPCRSRGRPFGRRHRRRRPRLPASVPPPPWPR